MHQAYFRGTRLIQTLRASRRARLGGMEDWRTGGKRSLGWKMGAWGLENGSLGVQNGLGTSKWETKCVPGGPNRGLEAPGTSKIGSWTIWKAVWRARGSPSWRFKGRFGRHLGAIWAPQEVFRGRFWTDLGVPNGSKRAIFFDPKSKSEK